MFKPEAWPGPGVWNVMQPAVKEARAIKTAAVTARKTLRLFDIIHLTANERFTGAAGGKG
jgi:hypothetical protein